MQYFICSVILLFSSFSFADGTSTTASTPTFSASDIAQVGSLISTVTGQSSGAGQAVNALALIQGISQLSSDLKTAPKVSTTITASATTNDQKFPGIVVKLSTLQADLSLAGLPSAASVSAIVASLQSFQIQKKICIESAESSSTMCVEGTSPGAIKVKALMNMAAPALSLISSAQKACSSTAQLTDFATKGLTIAKAACAGAKMMCDTSCSKTSTQMTEIMASIQKLNSTVVSEILAESGACTAMAEMSPQCLAMQKAGTEMTDFMAEVPPLLKAELTPQPPGSTGNLVAGCAANMKDLILLGANVAAMALSKSGADKCAAALQGAPTTTTAQYCEVSANVSTQFCQCKNNNAAQGCPGYVATTVAPPPPNSNDPSVDVKSTGSGNQFASGNNPIVPSNSLTSGGGLGSLNSTTDSSNKDKAPAGSAGSALGSVGTGSGSGAGAAPGVDSTGSDSKNLAVEKKKWSFGSFFGGGGSGSNGSSSDSKSLKLGQKNMEALKRQIASDQVRAEVSEASGKSNWEKVRERYLSNSPSLLNGQ